MNNEVIVIGIPKDVIPKRNFLIKYNSKLNKENINVPQTKLNIKSKSIEKLSARQVNIKNDVINKM